MVMPSWRWWIGPAAGLGLAVLVAGCSTVPRERLDECHKLSRTLEAEKSRLKDKVLSLQSQYEDIAQRADDDVRRLRIKDEENRRLLTSVQSYQSDVAEMASELSHLKNQIQLAVNPVSTALLEQFEDFAKGRPGCHFDPAAGVLTVSSDVLFEPGSDRLKPDARALLAALADLVESPEARDVRMLVAGHTDDSPVRRTALGSGPSSAPTRHLSLDRATRVRDVLAFEGRIDASTIEVAGFESSQPKVHGPDDAAGRQNRRIEIRLLGMAATPRAAGTAAGSGSAKP